MAFLRVWLYLWFPKGYSPLLSMPTWGPWMSIQRLTLGCYHCNYRGRHLSTPDLTSQYYSLAPGWPLVPSDEPSWPLKGLLMQVFPPPGPRPGFCGSLSCIFFRCGMVDPPMQQFLREDRMFQIASFGCQGPQGEWTRQPCPTSIHCGRGL